MGKNLSRQGGVKNNTKELNRNKELRRGREDAYIQFVPADLKSLRNCSRWLREPAQRLEELIRKLKKKLLKLREHLVQATVENVVSDLEIVQKKLKEINTAFGEGMARQQELFNLLKKSQPTKKKYNTNKEIYLLMKFYKGATKLHNEFKRNPAMLPPGMKEVPTTGAIRQRFRRYLRK